jgi:hypothetical protein
MSTSVVGKSNGASGSIDRRYLCTNYVARGRNTYATADTFTTILNVTGKGYLSRAILAGLPGAGTGTFLKITVDGVVTCYVMATLSGHAIGLLNYEDLHYESTGYISLIGPSSNDTSYYSLIALESSSNYLKLAQYPYTAGLIGVCLKNIDIYFETSLKIESAVGYTSVATSYHIEYGVI